MNRAVAAAPETEATTPARRGPGLLRLLLAIPACAIFSAHASGNDAAGALYDVDSALAYSQAAVGGTLGDQVFTDATGADVRLSDYAGKPLLVSMVFSSCYHVCPMTTRRLANAVEAAREALNEDSFNVITVGFDTARDTPQAMRDFAREQGVAMAGWDFLSGQEAAVARLAEDLGFTYFPSPRGFDHIVQVSIVDRDGKVHTQVYGEMFELPWLVEPLKDLVFNRPSSVGHPWASLVDRVRIFCTVYDPTTGRYQFDYSLFIQIGVGLIVILSVAVYLAREWLAARRRRLRT